MPELFSFIISGETKAKGWEKKENKRSISIVSQMFSFPKENFLLNRYLISN